MAVGTAERTANTDSTFKSNQSALRAPRLLLAVVVAFACGVLGGWLVWGGDAGSDSGISSQVQSLHDEWFAAWNAGDGVAAVELMGPGAYHYCPGTGTSGMSGDELAGFVAQDWSFTDAEILDVTSLPAVSPYSNDSYVAVSRFTLRENPNWAQVMVIEDRGGELLIVENRMYR